MNSSVWATGRSGTIGKNLPEQVKDLHLRFTDKGEIAGHIPDLSGATLIHLAAKVGHIGGSSDEIAWNINVKGTLKLAKLAIDSNADAFIFVSSSHVYAPSAKSHVETENLAPISYYGEQKASAEQELTNLFQGSLTRLVIARVFSVLDFGMNPNTLGGRIERAIQSGSDEVIPTAQDARDFLTPHTVAQVLVELAQKDSIAGVFNICSGTALTLSEATLRMIEQSTEARIPKFIEEHSAVPIIVGDPAKLIHAGIKTELVWDLFSKK